MASITIHSPAGRVGRTPVRLAPAPGVLAGLRLGVLDNRKPNARLLLTRLAASLAARTGAQVAVVVEKANAAVGCDVEALARLRSAADVVLTGSAD
jgi:hypothetical protein